MTAHPSSDADRAVRAVRASSPPFLISAISDRGQLGDLAERVQGDLNGRALADVPMGELTAIARIAVDATLAETPTSARSGLDIPRPALSTAPPAQGEAVALMEQLAAITRRWEEGALTALEAAALAESRLNVSRRSEPRH